MEMNNPGEETTLVSVAIIARNSKDDLRRLFNSLKKALSGIPNEIILVDNGSTDGTVEMLHDEFPDVKLTVNSENRGVAPARNQALKVSKGRYILILDADCEFQEGDLNNAMKYLEDNPGVGVLGFRIYYPDGKLQDTARTLPTPCDIFINRLDDSPKVQESITFRQHRMRDFDQMKLREAGFVAGACQFFKRTLLDEIGYLDDRMFYGYEDSDFCARIISKGKKIIYFPFMVFTHHHRRLTKKSPLSKMTLIQIKSYLIFHGKYKKEIGRINRELLDNNDPPEYLISKST